MTDPGDASDAALPPGDRLSFVSEWSEDRLITVEVFINEDGSEGWSAAYGRDVDPSRHQQLLKDAAAMLAEAAKRPPRRPPLP
jgi:hypothetical protein